MTWTRYEDDFFMHPKVVGLTPHAGWLWIRATAYSSYWNLDGVIPVMALELLDPDREEAPDIELLDAGLWHRQGHDCPRCPQPPDDTSAVIHDFAVYQPTSEDRARKVAAGRLGGKRSGETRKARASEANGRHTASRSEARASEVLKQDGSKPEATPQAVPVPVPKERAIALSQPPDGGDEREPTNAQRTVLRRRGARAPVAVWRSMGEGDRDEVRREAKELDPGPRATCLVHKLELPCRGCAADAKASG